MKKIRTTFQYDQYDITAMGSVLNEDNVENIQFTVHDIEEDLDTETLELIQEMAYKLLLDKAYTPELEF